MNIIQLSNIRTSTLVAVSLLSIIILWILSVLIFNNSSNEATQNTTSQNSSNLQKVQFINSVAQDRIKMIHISGITAPSRLVHIKAEALGKVQTIVAPEGSLVKKNDIILIIEKRDREAKLLAAIASVKRFEEDYKIAKSLNMKGFASATKLAAALENLENSRTKQVQAQIDLDNSIIKAPFDGIINKINVEEGSLVGPNVSIADGSLNSGNAVISIIENDQLLVIGNISENKISQVKVGLPCLITLIDGQKIEGEVRYINQVADQITRTFEIEIIIPNQSKLLNYGMTALISLPVSHQKSHHISSSHLTLNDVGEIGVKILDFEADINPDTTSNTTSEISKNIGIVKFYPIKEYDNDESGVWISGLPDKVSLITLGQAFVQNNTAAIGVLEGTTPTSFTKASELAK